MLKEKNTSKKNRISLKRRWIQLLSALIYNCDFSSLYSFSVSKSKLKHICVPGLNCYSCPGAISSCPLGAIQNSLCNGKIPFFVTALIILFGTFFGRMICSFLCPFGFFQELLYKIPGFKIKTSKKYLSITRKASLLKYFILIFLCIFLPILIYIKNGFASPYFCKFICPEGTIFASWPLLIKNEFLRESLGFIFSWKTILAVILIIFSILVFRPFCRFICPLGAIYSLFNKIAIFGIKVDSQKCTNCNACVNQCKMDTLKINDRECIRCGECISACKFNAISFGRKTKN